MAALIYLDTHVVAWLYAAGSRGLPEAVTGVLEETKDLRISPMVRLELQYLYEIGRVADPALPVVDTMEASLGVTICSAPFPAIIKEAEGLQWTRDPFDRLIVAHAGLFDATLLTKDSEIHRYYPKAVWERE